MPEPLRVAVVGRGFGLRVHVPALRSLPWVQVAAVVGRDHSSTVAEGQATADPPPVVSVADLVTMGLDAVTVAVPPSETLSVVRPLLESGLAVLIEKPLAATLSDAEQLAVAGRNKSTAVGFEFRELETFRTLSCCLRARSVERLEVCWEARSWDLFTQRWSWKLDQRRGGGVLPILGSHVLDLIEHVFGPITSASAIPEAPAASAFAPRGSIAAADTVRVQGEVSGWLPFEVDLTLAADRKKHVWRVYCSDGTIFEARNDSAGDWVAGFGLERTEGSRSTTLARDPRVPGLDGRVAPFRALAKRFLRATVAGSAFRPSFDDGLRVQQLLADLTV